MIHKSRLILAILNNILPAQKMLELQELPAKQDKNAVTYCHYEGYGINIPKNQKSVKKIIKKAQKNRRDAKNRLNFQRAGTITITGLYHIPHSWANEAMSKKS